MKKDNIEPSSETPFVVDRQGIEKEYWMKKLHRGLARSSFPYDRHPKGGAGVPVPPVEVEMAFTGELSSRLIALGTGKDHRIHMVLQAVLALLLQRYTGSGHLIVAVPIYKQEKDLRFINTVLPLCHHVPPDGDITFKELLLQVRQTLMEAVEHQNYPIDTLAYQLDLTFPEGEYPFSDTALFLDNIHDEKHIQPLKCNMVFVFARTGETVTGRVEYNPQRYEVGTAARIAHHFSRLLEAALDGLDKPVKTLDMLTPEERHQLLDEFNDTAVDYPRDQTLARLFARQTEQTPDRIAVIDLWPHPGRPVKDPQYITYRELSLKVHQLAHLLRQKGVGPDTVVALLAMHRIRLIIAKLAVLAAGGGYMTISPAYPPERIQFMMKDSNVGVLVKGSDVKTAVPGEGALEVLVFDHLMLHGVPAFRDTPPGLGPGSLAYVLYTSGSTGGPKGVMLENRNVVRLVKNTDFVPYSVATRMLQNSSPVFDVFVFETWGALLNGGQLILMQKESILDPAQLSDSLKRYQINMVLFTPVLFNQLVQQDSRMFGTLEWLLVGGDVLSPGSINHVRRDNPHLNVVNAYGPTENAVISTAYLIEEDYVTGIPIGGPINNSTAYILDIHNRLEPIGIIGELCVGGDGVARGYLNNPQLTAEKFIRLPGLPPSNMYKTGDLARWTPGGIIEFFGRRDYQVKIRGHRVELGEIEDMVLMHPDIKDSAVILSGDRVHPILSAYFVGCVEIPPYQLKDYLSERLPDYMVPMYFVQLEKLPLTATGKIDRNALPDPRTAVREIRVVQPPTNETETGVLQTWAEVLELDPETVGIDDDFFALGGNSINILKVQKELKEKFNRYIPMGDMFLYPTVKELAANIMSRTPKKKLDYVVKLNNGKNKKNIFIFHQLNGMIYAYKELAKLLEDRFNVYGVQAKGMTGEVPLPGSTDEMVNDYLPEIRAIQEKGPYILSGYCIGNALAYETARELEEQGEKIEKLVLVDVGSSMPEKVKLVPKLKILFERVLYALHVLVWDPGSLHRKEGENEEQQRLIRRIKSNNMKVVSLGYKYRRIIDSPIVHIRARKNLSQRLFQKTWAKMSKSTVDFFEMPGHHFNLYQSPNVEKLAEIINANV